MVYIALAVSALLIGIDQIIKFIVDSNMIEGHSIPVWDGVLHWTYLKNTGAAFGIFDQQRWLLVGITSIVILGCIYLLIAKKIKNPFLIWSVSLIIAGGIGNLIDRIFRQFVIDYIEIRLIHFAIFNFADCCVVIGTILVVCYLLFGDLIKKKREQKKAESATLTEETASAEEASIEETVSLDLEEDHAE
ncbi:MAG: signal peptidase II [Oscillospiraceae bacterium]|nr:signal peptidase II [Oscillospiraceae bacterium]